MAWLTWIQKYVLVLSNWDRQLTSSWSSIKEVQMSIYSPCRQLSQSDVLDVVWPTTAQSKIIESWMKRFHVPPVLFRRYEVYGEILCHWGLGSPGLVEDNDGERRICIDGKQRLTSLRKSVNIFVPRLLYSLLYHRFFNGEVSQCSRVKKWFHMNKLFATPHSPVAMYVHVILYANTELISLFRCWWVRDRGPCLRVTVKICCRVTKRNYYFKATAVEEGTRKKRLALLPQHLIARMKNKQIRCEEWVMHFPISGRHWSCFIRYSDITEEQERALFEASCSFFIPRYSYLHS